MDQRGGGTRRAAGAAGDRGRARAGPRPGPGAGRLGGPGDHPGAGPAGARPGRGLALLRIGVAARGRLGEVLAMIGGLVTVNGLVLGVQNATDRFDTWAYAWTLVVLAGPGIGRWLLGAVRGRRDLAAGGGRLIAAGLVAFGVLA